MCGVIGVYCPGVPVIIDSVLASEFIYHRGHDSSGIAVPVGKKIKKIADTGFFGNWPEKRKEEIRNVADNDVAILHVRYSTIGSKDTLLQNSQPLVINPGDREGKDDLCLAMCHNGHIFSTYVTERAEYETDVKQITFPIYQAVSHVAEEDVVTGVKRMMAQTRGSYSFVGYLYDGEKKLFFFGRDPLGIRPLYWAELEGGGVAVASEDVPLSNLEVGEDIRKRCVRIQKVPTGALFIYDGRKIRFYDIDSQPEVECGFEYVYFSGYGRKGMTEARKSLGKCLWRENPIDADMVVPIPDSGKIHAQGLSEASGIPLVEGGFARNRYKGERSFIQPTDVLRRTTIKRKITATQEMKGKRVILVDDSIIRGNTIGLVVEDAWKAEPEEIHIRIASPPVCFPCYLGIDMQEIDMFLYIRFAEKLGYNKFDSVLYRDGHIKDTIVESIRESIGVNSLTYLSYQGLKETLGDQHCFGCWNPDGYPETFRNEIVKLVRQS